MLLEYCQKLLDKFRYPWEMMPLMYAILKHANNVEEAERRIDEGKIIVCIKKQNNKKNLNTKFLINLQLAFTNSAFILKITILRDLLIHKWEKLRMLFHINVVKYFKFYYV